MDIYLCSNHRSLNSAPAAATCQAAAAVGFGPQLQEHLAQAALAFELIGQGRLSEGQTWPRCHPTASEQMASRVSRREHGM